MCKVNKEKCEYILENERLRVENEKLQAENESVKKELEKYKKPPKDSSNSSISSSQEKYNKKYPERKCSGRKPGGQKGHR